MTPHKGSETGGSLPPISLPSLPWGNKMVDQSFLRHWCKIAVCSSNQQVGLKSSRIVSDMSNHQYLTCIIGITYTLYTGHNTRVHDDVIKWKLFPHYWPFVQVNSPHKGQWCGALMFSLICTWTNCCANNLDTGDLRLCSLWHHYNEAHMFHSIFSKNSLSVPYKNVSYNTSL